MSHDSRRKPSSWKLVLASIPVLVLFGCKSAPPGPYEESGVKADVRIVAVKPPGGSGDESNANFDPATIKVRKRTQIVVWVLEGGGSLKIEFADNPFPELPICEGRFCVALKPPAADKPRGLYPYTATVTVDGKTTSADPNVEVVD